MMDAVPKEQDLLPSRKKTGPKPGGYNPGALKEGVDSRRLPGGRNNIAYQKKLELLEDLLPAAKVGLAAALKDSSHKDHVKACIYVHTSVCGSPVTQVQKYQQAVGESATDVRALSDEELMRLLNADEPLEAEFEELTDSAETGECD